MKVLLPEHVIKDFDPDKLAQAVLKISPDEIAKLPKEDSGGSISPNLSPLKDTTNKKTKKPAEFSIWASYDLENKKWEDQDKDRYQWFVAGFLYYYDTHLRNNAVDHQIYFEWKHNKVTVYMSPPHDEAHRLCVDVPANGGTTDPPRPPQGPPPPKGNT